jgi:hypothetical protein
LTWEAEPLWISPYYGCDAAASSSGSAGESTNGRESALPLGQYHLRQQWWPARL